MIHLSRNKAVAIASVLIALGAFMWLLTNERIWLIFASLTATTMFFSLSYCFYLEKTDLFILIYGYSLYYTNSDAIRIPIRNNQC